MFFGLFGSKKKQDSLADVLGGMQAYQRLAGHLSKAQSLQKLGRSEEARQALIDAEKVATNYLDEKPQDKQAHMMLVYFYCEVGAVEEAENCIAGLLSPGAFKLSDEENTVLSGELLKIQRQRPHSERTAGTPEGFTQVYCCAMCGRLHNYVSMPCPHCDWAPATVEEMAHSIILSNAHFKVPSLLAIAREIGAGRGADDVVPNLMENGKEYLRDPQQRSIVERVLATLKKYESKNHRSISMIRECSDCGGRILSSAAEECEKCGAPVAWPEAIRALACMDNLLWLFEQRLQVSNSNTFSDFVCVLVSMTNNLLRKQESPSMRDRQYSLKLLSEMEQCSDMGGGSVVDTRDLQHLRSYLIQDNIREDTEAFSAFILDEIEHFVDKMKNSSWR